MGWTWSSSTRSRRLRSSRSSRIAARSSSDCSSGCETSARPRSCSRRRPRRRPTSDSRPHNRGGTRRSSRTESSSSRCTRSRTSRFNAGSGSRRCEVRTTRPASRRSCSTRAASKSCPSSVHRWSMPNSILCPGCSSLNRPDAVNCRVCGRRIECPAVPSRKDPSVALQRVTSGEVFTAVVVETTRKPSPDRATEGPATAAATATSVEPNLEDNSDVLAAAVDGIRAKAQGEGHRFKPYVRSSDRKAPNAVAEREAAKHLHDAVALLREMRFADAIEPLLKAISRDDEDRRSWVLLAEAYLRVNRPYKAAVGYLRALELSPKDEQAWLGLARILRAIDDLPTAAAVLDRASRINPNHADTWAERGAVLESLQNLSEAMKSYSKVLGLKPDHRAALAKRQELEAKVPVSETASDVSASEYSPEDDSPAVPAETFDAIPDDLRDQLDDVLGPPTEEETRAAG